MRKGDMVVTTDVEASPKAGYREFSLGFLSTDPADAAWYDPTSPSSLIGVGENDFDKYGADTTPYAVRHVKWMRKGNWNALAPDIKRIVSGYTQACTEASDLDKACRVLKELIRVSKPVPGTPAAAPPQASKEGKAAEEAEEPAAPSEAGSASPGLLLPSSSSSSSQDETPAAGPTVTIPHAEPTVADCMKIIQELQKQVSVLKSDNEYCMKQVSVLESDNKRLKRAFGEAFGER